MALNHGTNKFTGTKSIYKRIARTEDRTMTPRARRKVTDSVKKKKMPEPEPVGKKENDLDVPVTAIMGDDYNEKREKQKQEDFDLIHHAVKGEQKAFENLMRRYQPQIFNLMYKMVHSSDEAQDLVQEAFMKAFASLQHFNYEYAFSTWLYKIATNNCIDHLRKKKLHMFSIDAPVMYKDDTYQYEIPDLTYYPDREMLRKERSDLIRCAIDQLPDKYKTVIQLRHAEELSYEEISEILKIPIGTVKARLFRAREMLNKFLKGKIEKGA
jgi:RNA polymerase sigma factor (sigma-70 family)